MMIGSAARYTPGPWEKVELMGFQADRPCFETDEGKAKVPASIATTAWEFQTRGQAVSWRSQREKEA